MADRQPESPPRTPTPPTPPRRQPRRTPPQPVRQAPQPQRRQVRVGRVLTFEEPPAGAEPHQAHPMGVVRRQMNDVLALLRREVFEEQQAALRPPQIQIPPLNLNALFEEVDDALHTPSEEEAIELQTSEDEELPLAHPPFFFGQRRPPLEDDDSSSEEVEPEVGRRVRRRTGMGKAGKGKRGKAH